jgi:hypothetical protein
VKVTVPAGEFDAFKVEGQGHDAGRATTFNYGSRPTRSGGR